MPIHCRVVKKLCDFDGSWTVSGALTPSLNHMVMFDVHGP